MQFAKEDESRKKYKLRPAIGERVKPLEVKSIINILEERNIDAVLPTMGGQTALNLCIEADEKGIWDKYGIDIIGIRYMHVYGSGQKRGFFGSLVKELVLNPSLGKPGRVTHSDAMIGWSYVDDPARATVMASKAKTNKTRSYSIMGDVRSVKDVVEYVKKIHHGH